MQMPTDGLHDGSCSASNAKIVCMTGACNTTTRTCATANGDTCESASECVSNICSADGKCGAVDGSACTDDSTCRSGCVANKCAASDPARLNGGGGCSSTGSAGWTGLAFIALFALLRRSRKAVAGVAAVLAVTSAATASAQSAPSSNAAGASIDTFRTAAAGSDWFANDSLDMRGMVRPSARVLLDWGHDPLIITSPDGTKQSTAIQNQFFFNMGAAVNLFNRVRVSANLPIAVFLKGFDSRLGGAYVSPASKGGIGDLGGGCRCSRLRPVRREAHGRGRSGAHCSHRLAGEHAR